MSRFVALALQVAAGAVQPEPAVPPRLLNERNLITADDYLIRSMQDNEAGIVSLFLRVSPSGKVASCDVTESSGFGRLDQNACSVVKKRARFEPARSVDGQAVVGEYRVATTWGLGNHMASATKAITLQVNKVPAGYASPPQIRLAFDATGHVDTCEVATSSGSAAADRAACVYSRTLTMEAPKSGAQGVAAKAVRILTVHLSDEPVQPSPAH